MKVEARMLLSCHIEIGVSAMIAAKDGILQSEKCREQARNIHRSYRMRRLFWSSLCILKSFVCMNGRAPCSI